ncbi:MAG: c-type cytochrome biogenesis protein CcmI, partial [Caldimonas sp.]
MAGRDPLAAARARLLKLKAEHEAGKLDARRYDESRRVVEREIGALLLAAEPEPPSAPAPTRTSGQLVGVLSLAVLALAAFGYWQTGSPS